MPARQVFYQPEQEEEGGRQGAKWRNGGVGWRSTGSSLSSGMNIYWDLNPQPTGNESRAVRASPHLWALLSGHLCRGGKKEVIKWAMLRYYHWQEMYFGSNVPCIFLDAI